MSTSQQAQREMWDRAVPADGNAELSYRVLDRLTGREIGAFSSLDAAQRFRSKIERSERGRVQPWIEGF